MFFEKVKSCELSSETRRTEKKIRNKKRRTSNNCRKHIKKWFNNYLFFEKVKSYELSSKSQRTEKKMGKRKPRTSK